ncbi:MAG: DUF5906 domain-containing protein [Pseudomonadota bacterium]
MDDYDIQAAETFLRLFDGNQDRHISLTPKGSRDKKGKAEVEVTLIDAPVTLEMANAHLLGQASYGIAPVKSDSTCAYGVLDFDIYDMLEDDVLQVQQRMRCPSAAFRTKSRGLHVVVFPDEPVSAKLMHDFLASKRRNMPKDWQQHIEIFPKASQVLVGPDDKPTSVNLPLRGQQCQIAWVISESNSGSYADDADLLGVLRFIDEKCRIDATLLADMAKADPVMDDSDLGYKVPVDPAGRNDLLMRIARSMQSRGWTDSDIKAELFRLNQEGVKFHEAFADGPLAFQEIEAMWKTTIRLEKGSRAPLHYRIVEKFNREWAMMIVEGKVEFLNKEDGDCYPKNSFFDMTAPHTVPTKNGPVPMAKLWMMDVDRNEYRGIVIESPDYEGAGFNVFEEWAVTPKRGDPSLWIDYIENIVCGGDKDLAHWVMTYLADAIQRPWSIHPGSALALRGGQGGGKTFLGRAMRKLLGERHARTIHGSTRMFDRFNRDLFGSTFVLCEEALFAGSRQQAATMKSFVTSDVWTYEQKYLASFTGKNVHRVIATTNATQAVHIDNDDRRWTVIEMNSKFEHDPNSREARAFWQPYYDLVDDNAGLVLQYLLDYEVDRGLIGYGYVTEAKKSDKIASDPLLALMNEIAETGVCRMTCAGAVLCRRRRCIASMSNMAGARVPRPCATRWCASLAASKKHTAPLLIAGILMRAKRA